MTETATSLNLVLTPLSDAVKVKPRLVYRKTNKAFIPKASKLQPLITIGRCRHILEAKLRPVSRLRPVLTYPPFNYLMVAL